MDHGLFKHWPIICFVSATTLALVVLKMVMQPSAGLVQPVEQSYEMLRPKPGLTAAYDLSGRPVIRTLHSIGGQPESSPKASAKAQGHSIQTPKPAKAPVAPNNAKAQADARAKAAAQRAAQAKKAEEKRRAELAIRMNAEAEQRKRAALSSPHEESVQPTGPVTYANDMTTDTQTPDAENTHAEDKVKLSPAAWRSLLHAQPTVKNANDLIAAFRRGEIDSASFYRVCQDLISDSSAERQKIGLMMVRQEPSSGSFSFLVENYKETTPEPLKTDIYSEIRNYAQPARFQHLNKALSADKRSAQMATRLLAQVVSAQLQTNNQSSGRDLRSPGSAPISASALQGFLPSLKRLSGSQDPAVAQEAQRLVENIQSLKSV